MDEKKLLNWPGLQYLYYTKIFPYYKRAFYGIGPVVPPVDPQPTNEIWYTSSDNEPIAEFDTSGAFGTNVELVSNEYDGQKFIAKYNNPVTELTNYVLCDNVTLTSISLPSTVSFIEAVIGCPYLNAIHVDSDNPYFDSRDNCNAIIDSSTNELILGSGATTIHSSVIGIGAVAFYGSKLLTSITIPSNITYLGYGCFHQCENIKTIDLSNSSIDTIPENCFANCYNLETLLLNDGLKTISQNFISGSGLKEINIPKTVTTIKYRAFYNSSIENVVMEDGGTETMTIKNYAFATSTLKMLRISNSVDVIEKPNFRPYGSRPTTSLEYIEVSSDNTTFDSRNDCNAIFDTETNKLLFASKNTPDISTIPDLKIIGEGAFQGISTLTTLTVPSSVTEIEDSAFDNCINLTSAIISGSVETIGGGIFTNCTSLVDVSLEEGIKTLGDYTFSNCPELVEIVIPESVTTMGIGTFNGCSSLSSAIISSGITVIPNNTFYKCTSLSDVHISNDVTEIGNYAFYDCSSLTSIELPDSVTSIGNYAFASSSSLYKVICRATIPPTLGNNAFSGLYSTYTIQVPSASVNTYKSKAGWSSIASHITSIP